MLRQTALRSSLRASQRSQRRLPAARFQTTQAGQGTGKVDHSHALAGLAGGVAVLGGLYAYYHISGTAKIVQTARTTLDQAQQAKDKLVGAAPSPKDAVGLLKGVVKAYAGAIPGSGQLVDSTFDQLEFLADKYGDDVSKIAKKTYSDVQSAISDGKNTGESIMRSLQDASARLTELAGDKGQQLLDQALKGQPELRKAVGDAQQDFQQLVEKHGPKARDIAMSTYASAAAIVSKGSFNTETIDNLKQLLNDKTNQLRQLAQEGGSEAWQASAKRAGPLLDQMPDLRKKAEEQIEGLKGVVGEDRVKAVREMYDELSSIASGSGSNEDKAKKARDAIEKRVGSFEDLRKNASSFKPNFDDSMLKKIPGYEEISSIINNNDWKQLREVATKHGEEAEKILNSTYDEIKEVLRKRAGEAKQVAQNAQRDAKA